jgi:hypothetical protein
MSPTGYKESTMSVVDLAERKSQLRAIIFYILALAILASLTLGFGPASLDVYKGAWVAMATASAINMALLGKWLKPNNQVARLIDDETANARRRTSTTAGFWAAIATAFALALAADDGTSSISAENVARIIITAALVAALCCFATLELRAAR